ncbi:hypothetical protein PHYBOEH_002660 [Phytophthora boehmeriae]|uniref:TIP41-like protein n=1 Tax=Phytophthora boehmeriae TaxID=109152 RepID=A0A8T1WWE5_9STRA|nr:hypothetical protein PHYBOEH_002660 [Phytophthora boehmeriae]
MSSSSSPQHSTNPPAIEASHEISGWSFSCRKAPAMSSAQRDQLSAELHLAPAIPLPEVVFADSALQVDYPACGLSIHFDAREALHTWMQDHAGATDHWKPSSFDFTYSTTYMGTVAHEGSPVKIDTTSEKLPLDKLQQQVAILFYDRVILFEDDIRDLGEIYIEVRARAMEFGFLLLCRYYCRIDDKNIKLVDSRYYHEFGDDFVWRDHEIREASIPDLKKVLRSKHIEQQDAPIELSADIVYGMLQPTSSHTEKIHLA